MADQYVAIPVKSKNPADLSVRLRNVGDTAYMGDATTPVVVTVNNATVAVTATQLPAALGQTTMANSLAVTLASNQSALPITDNAGSLTVDAPVGTPVFTRLSDGTTALTTTSGRLAVDGSGVTQPVSGTVTSNQGTAAAGSAAWPVTVTTTGDTVVKPGDSGNNAIRVNVVAGGSTAAPTAPARSFQTISALAISTRTAINFTELGAAGSSGRLAQIVMASTVLCKWELFTLTNSVESGTALAVFFTTAAHPTYTYATPHPNYITIAATAGSDNFRLYATNLDNALAADVYATAFWDFS